MSFSTTARIIEYDFNSNRLVVQADELIDREIFEKEAGKCELRLDDGRSISAEQRRKVFAIIKDIALWSGHEPEYIRSYLTWDFCKEYGSEYFSLSNVDMTTAKDLISYLVEFCFRFGVPTRDTLLNRTDDIGRYLYACLLYKRCAVCNSEAELHHTDRVGMGFDRKKISHIGLKVQALCRKHHSEAHALGQTAFDEKYHIYGIELDSKLCRVYRT